jgi:hypothetical protein
MLANAVSGGEKITLENRNIHDFLFQHVTWNQEEDSKNPGFYIKTFEFKPPQEILFKLFSNWSILKFFNFFGISDFISKDMENVYASSSAFGAISIKNLSRENALLSGMVLERIWLAATKDGLAFQPTTAIALLMLPIRDGALSGLSQNHIEETESIVFVFRLGYADPPKARSKRIQPIIEVL